MSQNQVPGSFLNHIIIIHLLINLTVFNSSLMEKNYLHNKCDEQDYQERQFFYALVVAVLLHVLLINDL